MTDQFHYKKRFQQLKGFCAAVPSGSISKAALLHQRFGFGFLDKIKEDNLVAGVYLKNLD